MKNENQYKWESWAEELHEGNTLSEGIDGREQEGKDWNAVKRIFAVREKVEQIRRLGHEEAAWAKLKKQLSPKYLWKEMLKYAAVFVAAIVISGLSFYTYESYKYSQSEYACITSPNGQITNVTLFDGTDVWLNAGSTLKYNQYFNRDDRKVFLDGEALFKVTKDTGKPFIVNAGKAQIKVHGTVFDVKAYRQESQITTVLLEGKVQFLSRGKSVMMHPGEQLLFTKKTGQIAKNKVDTSKVTAWKGGKIYFNNETLENLILQLERWYEVKFRFENEHIKSYHFSGVINKDRSLNYTLKIIQDINKVNFEIKEDQIIIKDAN